VKRVFAALLLVALGIVAVYGYYASRRERTYRRLVDMGDAALARDDTFAAIEAFSGAITWKTDSMVGYLKRGEAYRRRNELESALRDLRKASELDPLAPAPLELLGDVNAALGRYSRAAERYQKCVGLDDRSPRVLYKLALARYRDGQAASAVAPLRAAIVIDDRFAEAYYLLGLCLRETQHLDEALKALERSVAIAPAMLHAREELGDLYGRLGRRDDRLTQLEALLALDPGPSREVALGLAYAQGGQANRAVLTLGRAAERYPDDPYTYVALGRVWLETAQSTHDRVALSKALGALEEAVGSDDSSEALTLFGRALLLAGDEELAERMLQQATEKLPADPLAFYYLGDAAERRGHDDVARRALLDYQVLQGDEQDAQRRAAFAARLGDLSARLTDYTAAMTWYQRAVDAGGADASLLVRQADAQAHAGDIETARVTVAKALEKEPANRLARALQRRLK